MVVAYAESSAVLRWLLGATDAEAIAGELGRADRVVTSALTTAEVGRTLRRLVATDDLRPDGRDRAWVRFTAAAAHWSVYAVTDSVLSRAAESFPAEPIRTLDAIHLATAAQYNAEVEALTVVSVDDRLRQNASGLGLGVAP